MAGLFNFSDLRMEDKADIRVIDENFKKIELELPDLLEQAGSGRSGTILNVTVPAAAWVKNATTELWEWYYANAEITPTTVFNFAVHLEFLSEQSIFWILPITETIAGRVKLYAVDQPEVDIVIDFHYIEGE